MDKIKACRDCGKNFIGTVQLTCPDCFRIILANENLKGQQTAAKAWAHFQKMRSQDGQ